MRRINPMRRIAAVIAVLAAGLIFGVGTAHADSWPVDPGPGSPVRPIDATGYMLTPDQPNFWNPSINITRVISPYGRSTTVICTGYVVDTDCWQADPTGAPHKLQKVFNMGAFGPIVTSTPAPNVFLYPGMIPGL
ncbi:hypothetical protein OG921_12800 [Aldersonia sp. NBC_00410]|uniref:hypothetical protein n=1 Tax=Aldersonia sp. NBC_00410 TaxID=2975954 RepID=UPI002253CECE|nr:hypothetical protein [Aldersonia sp. NBC_00410]MCX5044047.1 hypothetical protein [Aldersonia sp. NBC_00410]